MRKSTNRGVKHALGQLKRMIRRVVQQRGDRLGSADPHSVHIVLDEGFHDRCQGIDVICCVANSTEAAERAACPLVEFSPALRKSPP